MKNDDNAGASPSTVQHTPGPWTMNGPTLRGNGYNIGSVNSHRTSEGAANARLIAAAPELLAALRLALQRAECDLRMFPLSKVGCIEHQSLETAADKYRAAIAKATNAIL